MAIAAWRSDWSWMRSKACAAYHQSDSDGSSVGDDVGELVLHRLEGADGLAELLARERVARRHVEAAARAAVGVGGEQHEAGVARAVDRGAAAARS